MIRVSANLFIGGGSDCFYTDKSDWAVVHACKDPCHKIAVNYTGNLNKTHPNYLICETGNHLFLNLVDMAALSNEYTEPIIFASLNFIEKNISSKNILIHCNIGRSRSPALALLFLAKRKNVISNESYQKAKEEFNRIFPNYMPGRGIETYLYTYWTQLK